METLVGRKRRPLILSFPSTPLHTNPPQDTTFYHRTAMHASNHSLTVLRECTMQKFAMQIMHRPWKTGDLVVSRLKFQLLQLSICLCIQSSSVAPLSTSATNVDHENPFWCPRPAFPLFVHNIVAVHRKAEPNALWRK